LIPSSKVPKMGQQVPEKSTTSFSAKEQFYKNVLFF
jgi:hypothetical protein